MRYLAHFGGDPEQKDVQQNNKSQRQGCLTFFKSSPFHMYLLNRKYLCWLSVLQCYNVHNFSPIQFLKLLVMQKMCETTTQAFGNARWLLMYFNCHSRRVKVAFIYFKCHSHLDNLEHFFGQYIIQCVQNSPVWNPLFFCQYSILVTNSALLELFLQEFKIYSGSSSKFRHP